MGCRGGRGTSANAGCHDTSATSPGYGIFDISEGDHGGSITSRGCGATTPHGRREGHSLSKSTESST